MKKREGNYDLLRIVCAIAVIMIHVSATWFSKAVNDIADSGLLIEEIQSPFFICVYNSISRFAVPCFIMLSGAFLLDNKKNLDYRKFYAKSFEKIGAPSIIFSLLYILYRMPFCFVGEDRELSTLLKDIVKGSPMYHMWYLYMLIGVYAMVPVVLRFKNSISENTFYKFSFIFLVLANISRWTTGMVRLNWNIGQSFEYLGYFMVGYSIRKRSEKCNNYKAAGLILLGIIIELCAAVLEYWQIVEGISESELKYKIVSPYSPLIVSASVLIFWGFTIMNVRADFTGLSGITFLIYLIHAGVWDFITKVFYIVKGKNFLTNLDGAVWILVFVIIVFGISCSLSKIYIWIWAKLDKEKRITNFLSHIVRLKAD